MTQTKSDLGYTTIRISKKAHRKLAEKAIRERRTLHAQFDIILGV